MSSIPQPGPEALVTVKVTYENTPRRVKMPLRDMVPHTLEDNVGAIHISFFVNDPSRLALPNSPHCFYLFHAANAAVLQAALVAADTF